jgi:hypothetical protein
MSFMRRTLTHGERGGGAGSIAAARRTGHSTPGFEPATIRPTDVDAPPVRRQPGPQGRQSEPGETPGRVARRVGAGAGRCNVTALSTVFDLDRP